MGNDTTKEPTSEPIAEQRQEGTVQRVDGPAWQATDSRQATEPLPWLMSCLASHESRREHQPVTRVVR